MTVEIRRVRREEDFQRLHDLFVEYENDLPPDLRHGWVPDTRALTSRYDGDNAAFLAMNDARAIGCVALTRLDVDTGVLARLFVRRQDRGMGAARALVTAVIEYLRERGGARVVLDTAKERLDAAYRLYLSLGFKECAPYGSVTYRHPTFMELWIRSESESADSFPPP